MSFPSSLEKSQLEVLQHLFKIEQMLSEISARFIIVTNLDETIKTSLADIGELIQANRAYVVLFHENNTKMSNTTSGAPLVCGLLGTCCRIYRFIEFHGS